MIFRLAACAEAIEFWRRTANCAFAEFLPFAVRTASVKFPQLAACFVVRIAAMELLSFAAHIVAVEFRRLATRAIAPKFLRSAVYAVFAPPYDVPFD